MQLNLDVHEETIAALQSRAEQYRADAERLRLQLKAATYMVNIAYHAFSKLLAEKYFMPHAEVDWWMAIHSKVIEWLHSNHGIGICPEDKKAIDAAIEAARAKKGDGE